MKTIHLIPHNSNEAHIKEDVTKYITPKIFHAHKLEKNDDINFQEILSSYATDLFKKALPIFTFKKLVH